MADITLTQDDDDELARLASTSARPLPSSMDDYEIGRELGSGSFATCWSARHKRTGQEVAVKVIEVRPGQGMQQMAEIEHMVKVGRHPSVLEMRDARLEGAYIYLISPLCQGSLLERVEQPYTAEQWLHWFLQAAEGLSLLHRCQIVHCDVKPANLLLDRHDRLLLADLGRRGRWGIRARAWAAIFTCLPSRPPAVRRRPVGIFMRWEPAFTAP